MQTIYRYKYAHRSSRDPYPAYTGVKHGDDVEFVFGTPLFDNLSEEYQEEEVELAEDLVNYWSTFVKTGYSFSFLKKNLQLLLLPLLLVLLLMSLLILLQIFFILNILNGCTS